MWLVLVSLVHVTLRISLDVHGDQQSFVASSRSFCRFFRLFVTQQWKVGNVNMVLEGYSFVGLFVIVQKLFITVRETLNIQSAFLNIKWVLFQIHHARSCNKLPWTVHHITWNQRDRRRRALLQHQNFDFLFYLGWSGCFYYNEGCAKLNYLLLEV